METIIASGMAVLGTLLGPGITYGPVTPSADWSEQPGNTSEGPRRRRVRVENPLRAAASTAMFPEAVRENEEVVPVNAVSAWVLLSEVTAGRQVVRERRF
ncbi:hypothetical protein AB0A94_25310 [Streptomyces sp. NPDC044984]|uniref:hypothetical protein n=1 Tax=Streptomyces sp. NPDC044984 TaxID=3154335 RepID=UPI0033D565B1